MCVFEDSAVEIEQYAHIVRLMARYCSASDARDGQTSSRLFTEDGELVLPSRTVSGRAGLARFMSAGPKATGHHHAGNVVVDFVSPTSARATSYVTVLEPGQPIQRMGTYFDDLEKVEGTWLFRTRKLVWDE
jgi:uncharacterized protein (TIGR02246 family)